MKQAVNAIYVQANETDQVGPSPSLCHFWVIFESFLGHF